MYFLYLFIFFISFYYSLHHSRFLSLLRREKQSSEHSVQKEGVLSLDGSHLTASAKSSVFGILLFVCVTWDECSKHNNEGFEWRHCFCRVGCQSSAVPPARRHKSTVQDAAGVQPCSGYTPARGFGRTLTYLGLLLIQFN